MADTTPSQSSRSSRSQPILRYLPTHSVSLQFLAPTSLPRPLPTKSLPQCPPQRPTTTCRKSNRRSPDNPNPPHRARSAKRSALYQAMRQYRTHFQTLIHSELQAHQAAILQRHPANQTSPPMLATHTTHLFSQTVFTLHYPTIPKTLIQPFTKGDLIHITPHPTAHHPPDHTTAIEATLLRKSRASLVITVPTRSDAATTLLDYSHIRLKLCVQRGTNLLAFDRANDAVTAITHEAPATPSMYRLLVMSFPQSFLAHEGRELGMVNDLVWEMDVGSREVGEWNECVVLAGEKVGRGEAEVEEEVRRLKGRLNPSQVAAVRAALRRRLTLVQGPPGTGKTLVASFVVRCAVRLGLGPVLACAASNVAADNLLRCMLRGASGSMRVVRVGRVAAVDEDLWGVTLESMMGKNVGLRKARTACERGEMRVAELIEMERKVVRKILGQADVVVATCVGCGRAELKEHKFPFVVVDEATQATEPDVLIPLAVGISDGQRSQLVLVGDHHQLPPTVLSQAESESQGIGLETSLFMRMWEHGVACKMLNVQYRMHPDIAHFPASHFYFKRLRNGITAEERPLPTANTELVPQRPLTSRVVFVNVANGEEQSDRDSFDGVSYSRSYFNVAECSVVSELLQVIISDHKFDHSDIGVISPYSGQVKLIGDKLQSRKGPHRVEVCTVDGYQGREAEVVILSTVRNNSRREVGFLQDWRRLNVAISRARVLLIVVGDENTLATDYNWRSWLKWVKRHGVKVTSESLFPQESGVGMEGDCGEETETVTDLCSTWTSPSSP